MTDRLPSFEGRQRALATREHLIGAVRRALAETGGSPRRAPEVASHLLAFCHGRAMLLATGLLDAGSTAAVDRAVTALLGVAG